VRQPHARLKAPIRLPALKIQVSALSTFAPCEKTAARVVLRPLPAAPRASAALSAASGRSPRALGGFSVQALASSGARSAMSPSGEVPPRTNDCTYVTPLYFQQEIKVISTRCALPARKPSQQGAPALPHELCRSMPVALLLFVAHARCAVANCCSMTVACCAPAVYRTYLLLIALLLYLAARMLRSDSLTAFSVLTFNSQMAKAKAEAIGQEGSP
jgi:hypothetical protein